MLAAAVIKGHEPAGLVGSGVEIYFDKKRQRLRAFYDGEYLDFFELPLSIISKLKHYMLEDDDAMVRFLAIGLDAIEDQLFHYYRCGFGALSPQADFSPCSGELNPELWECGCNGSCPLKGHFDAKLECQHGRLTHREVEVLKHLQEFMPGKAIAQNMGITEDTYNKHKRSLFDKTGMESLPELLLWANQNALL